jgi:hypothetical protein
LIYLSNMESQQIVDYIRQQLAAGHTEDRLRQHLLLNGWSAPQVENAFKQYDRAVAAPAPTGKKAKKRTPKQRQKRLRATRWWRKPAVKAVVVLAVVGVVGLVARTQFRERIAPPTKPVQVHYTYQQMQAIDVNTVGSAISQYSVANAAIPTSISIAPDGNLVLCGEVCNPLTSEVNALTSYKPSSVSFQTYAPGIAVMDKDQMYIVPGATCKNKGKTVDSSAAPKAMVILYGQTAAAGLNQRCVIL